MSSREHLRGLATRGIGSDVSLEALWLSRALWANWPPRRPPWPLRLIRRPDASTEQWDAVHAKLDGARPELAAAGVDVRIEWGEWRATVTIDDGPRQLDIFDVIGEAA